MSIHIFWSFNSEIYLWINLQKMWYLKVHIFLTRSRMAFLDNFIFFQKLPICEWYAKISLKMQILTFRYKCQNMNMHMKTWKPTLFIKSKIFAEFIDTIWTCLGLWEWNWTSHKAPASSHIWHRGYGGFCRASKDKATFCRWNNLKIKFLKLYFNQKNII
jgi:hypothetical protein